MQMPRAADRYRVEYFDGERTVMGQTLKPADRHAVQPGFCKGPWTIIAAAVPPPYERRLRKQQVRPWIHTEEMPSIRVPPGRTEAHEQHAAWTKQRIQQAQHRGGVG